MRIRLCRLFNVFHKSTMRYALVLLCATLIIGFVYGNFWYVLLIPIFCSLYCLNFSKHLEIDRETITYRDFKILPRSGGTGFKYIYSNVTKKVVDIEYNQNIAERLFNVGHIDFTDDLGVKHSIYGIKNFDISRREAEKILFKHNLS